MRRLPAILVTFLLSTTVAYGNEAIDRVAVELRTGHPITVAELGDDEAFHALLKSPQGGAAVRCRLHLRLTDDRGTESEWTSGVISIPGGGGVRVTLGEAFDAVGWYRVQPTLVAAEGDDRAEKAARQFAVIEPLESRTLPPSDGFWFGFDSRVRTPAMLRLLSRMGVDVLRYGTWARVNPAEGEYDWKAFDEVVGGMRKHGMQPLYSVTFTPPYAMQPQYRGKGDPSRFPPRPEALRAALESIVPHAKARGVTIYYLWNEPDHRGFWKGTTDEYLEFLKVAAETIHRLDPEATVLSGGIASLHPGRTDGPNGDLDRRLIVGGRPHYDALALHEHGTFERFTSALDGPLAEHLRQVDERPPLWFTETGYDGDPLVKAACVVQKFVYARARGARGMIWYALYPPGEGGRYNVIDAHGDPQPAIPAYSQMVRRLRGKRFAREFPDSTESGNQLFSFEGDGETVFVAWGRGATAFRAPIRVAAGTAVRGFDLMGRPFEPERVGNVVRLPFSESPRYLVVEGAADVAAYEPIPPLAVFEFGSLEPTQTAAGVDASSLATPGWARPNANDDDPRMAGSTSGAPGGAFDGEGEKLALRFTVTPERGPRIELENLGFWGNSGAFNGTEVTLTCRVGDREPVRIGQVRLRNLSAPRTKGEYHAFPLGPLGTTAEPVTFSLGVNRGGQRAILKIDDLRLDGAVRR